MVLKIERCNHKLNTIIFYPGQFFLGFFCYFLFEKEGFFKIPRASKFCPQLYKNYKSKVKISLSPHVIKTCCKNYKYFFHGHCCKVSYCDGQFPRESLNGWTKNFHWISARLLAWNWGHSNLLHLLNLTILYKNRVWIIFWGFRDNLLKIITV